MIDSACDPDDFAHTPAIASSARLEPWGWSSVAINNFLASLHGAVAVKSGSLAVSAELAHNIVDLFAVTAVLTGLSLASRKSASFPYGLYNVENLTAAGLAVLIFVSAYEIVREAVMAPPAPIRAAPWMLVLLLLTTHFPGSSVISICGLRDAGIDISLTDKVTLGQALSF